MRYMPGAGWMWPRMVLNDDALKLNTTCQKAQTGNPLLSLKNKCGILQTIDSGIFIFDSHGVRV